MIVGKDVKPLVEKLKSVDWKSKADNVIGEIKEYAVKTGRVAVRPMLQFYYVMSDAETTTMEKAMIYAAIIYTVSPISIIPSAVFIFSEFLMKGPQFYSCIIRLKIKLHHRSTLKWMIPSRSGSGQIIPCQM